MGKQQSYVTARKKFTKQRIFYFPTVVIRNFSSIVEHGKRNFESPSHYEIFFLLCKIIPIHKHTKIEVIDDFLKIFDLFPKISESPSKHIQGLYNLPDIVINQKISPYTVMNKEFLTQTVRGITNITDRDDNWNSLLCKEAYHIKLSTPFLNTGLEASGELCLFS